MGWEETGMWERDLTGRLGATKKLNVLFTYSAQMKGLRVPMQDMTGERALTEPLS